MFELNQKHYSVQFLSTFIIFLLLSNPVLTQTNNPIEEKIRASGLLFELEEMTTIQRSNAFAPLTRINMLREVPDGSGRLFVIDLNGFLWSIDQDQHSLFLSIKDFFAEFTNIPGKGTGFGAFAFHPEFQSNGKFYTSHAEFPTGKLADYSPPFAVSISLQWVVVEWTVADIGKETFTGTFREILRVDYPDILHGIQDIQFNPTINSDEPDYGNLYICLGEGGSSLNFQEENIQTTSSYLGTIFRIDPLGSNSQNGQYGIPADNPFINDTAALPEIYCFGFRNPHRISWDTHGEQLMFIGDIGEKNIEEVNIGSAGANYGWGKREGTYLYDRSKGRDFVYPLPSDDQNLGFTYPVAQYDHSEGLAIVGGYVYRGNRHPELYGHYIFGDIPSGRVFHFPVLELENDQTPEIKELNFLDENGDRTTFLKLVENDRADLRFGIDGDGEIYFLTKADGKVRRLKSEPLTRAEEFAAADPKIKIYPNPFTNQVNISWNGKLKEKGTIRIYNASGVIHKIIPYPPSKARLVLKDLPQGLYFLQLDFRSGTYFEKLIKH